MIEQTWDVLAEALDDIDYRREPPPLNGRRFDLRRDDEHNYAVLYIFTYNPNTYRPGEMRHTRHEFVVPVATYHKAGWTRWVFDRIASIEFHETCENFLVKAGGVEPEDECKICHHRADAHDGRNSSCAECAGQPPHRFEALELRYYRPYAPHHGNGWDPYTFWPGGSAEEKAKAPGDD